jgi:hypothetical protein
MHDNHPSVDITTIKTDFAASLANQFTAMKEALFAHGFDYDFSGFLSRTDQPCGILTLQMDPTSQQYWSDLLVMVTHNLDWAEQGCHPDLVPIRTAQNITVMMPHKTVILLLTHMVMWKCHIVTTCSHLKDQVAAMATDPTNTLQDMTTVVWPPSV